MSIGQNIKKARKSRGFTQVQLADKAKISRSYLGDIESDRYNPSLETLKKIAEVLKISTGELVSEGSILELAAADNGMSSVYDYLQSKNLTETQKQLVSMIQTADDETLKQMLKVLKALSD